MNASKTENYDIEPINNRVMAEPVELNSSDAGIILPEAGAGKQAAAKVLYVGPGVARVKPGDVVLYHNYVEFPFFGKKLLSFHENELLGIIHAKGK